MARPAPARIDLKACSRPIPVDQRASLSYYYRIADNLLRQANIYREEKDNINLYIILLRYSSLLCDTIPAHRAYAAYDSREKIFHKKNVKNVIVELETLKPAVQREVDEYNRQFSITTNGFDGINSSSLAKNQISSRFQVEQMNFTSSSGRNQIANSGFAQPEKQSHKLSLNMAIRSLNIPLPKEETLSRHSILGSNGLVGRWPQHVTGTRVEYPSTFDFSENENPSLPLSRANIQDSILSLDDNRWSIQNQHLSQPSVTDLPDELAQLNIRQPTPPPVLAQVQTDYRVIPPEKVADPRPGTAVDGILFQNVHVPVSLMESFLRVAEANTRKNLETCAVLTGKLKNSTFYITTLIIPKQTSTSDSCQTENEEELFTVQSERDLFTVGWIHTHPSQTCFLSSIDLHTHYSYQVMLPEAIAIVMAPKDPERKHGIFHLTNPSGMSIINKCQATGFHPHEEPLDGSSIYEHCSHVYMNPKVDFEVLDLRKS